MNEKLIQNAVIRSIEVVIHHYFGVDLKTIWKSVKEDIPKLKKDIQEILEREGN